MIYVFKWLFCNLMLINIGFPKDSFSCIGSYPQDFPPWKLEYPAESKLYCLIHTKELS